MTQPLIGTRAAVNLKSKILNALLDFLEPCGFAAQTA